MRCPRCGEDNLPGLAACLGCGQDLLTDPADLEISTRPRVRAANPLDTPPQPARPRRSRLPLSDGGLILFGPILSGLLLGLLVGVGPWRRGDRRAAGILLASLAGSILAGLLLWYSAIQPVAWMAVLTVLASAAYIEARARVPQGIAGSSVPIALFAMSMALCLHVVAAFAYDTWFPRILIPDMPGFEGGAIVVDRVGADELAVDDLVAVGDRVRFWEISSRAAQAGPVLALAGQHVDSVERGFLVDGEPARVHIFNTRARAVPQLPPGGIDVPEGHVAVLVDPITVARPEDLLGRLSYRWTPAADRGPIVWPPPESLETP